jgi:hypothetical protein
MNRTQLFTIRMTDKERAALGDICRMEGLKASETVRLLIRQGLDVRNLPPVWVNRSENEQSQRAN